MKIVLNNTEAAIFAGGKLLIPGTNSISDGSFDEKKGDVKDFVSNGDLTIYDSEKMTDADKKKAVDNITTQENLEALEKGVKGVDTSKAKKKLDDFEKQLKKQQA